MTFALKRKHTFHTEDEVRAARRRATETRAGRQYLQHLVGEVKHLLPLSWDELWEFVPPVDIPRTTLLNGDLLDRTAKSGEESGCPVHGPEIFWEHGNRSWLLSPEHPWKVRCPIGGELYPTNDFGAYLANGRREKLDTTRKYVDDGTGYVDRKGRRYFFIAYYNQHCRWSLEVIWAARVFGRLYLLTQDLEYARRGAILLLRTASLYPLVHRGSQTYPPGEKGKLFMWCEEYYATAGPLSEAYDDLFEYLQAGGDADVAEFLRRRGICDPCLFVEHNFIQHLFHTAALTEELVANPGYLEQAVSAVLAALGPVETAAGVPNPVVKMTDFVLHGGHYHGLSGLLWSNLWHDGFPSSNLEYNAGITKALLLTLDRLAIAGTSLWEAPRARLLAESIGAFSLGGMFAPSTGDGGGCSGLSPFGRHAFRPAIRAAYRGLRDPRLIPAFHAMREQGPDPWDSPWLLTRAYDIRALELELFDHDLEETGERLVDEARTCFVQGTRHFPGYGIAFLESGRDDSRRALSVTYGSSASGHHHCDRLNLELAWRDRVLLPDLGYPEAWLDKYQKWSRNTVSHYCVVVDRKRQDSMAQGALLFLGDAGPVHALEAENSAAYDVTTDYRRQTALVDLGDEAFYVLDVFRVRGGGEHHWSFHGPAAKAFEVQGVDVPAPREGSFTGEDVPFGALTDDTSGFQFLTAVRDLSPEGNFSAQWLQEKGGALVRATVLTAADTQYLLCDGQPERRTCEARWLQYLIAARNGQNLSSMFGVLVDAWREDAEPGVMGVEQLDVSGEGTLAVSVTHSDGTDVLVSTPGPDCSVTVGDLELTGRLGFVRSTHDGRVVLALFDGTCLRCRGHELLGPDLGGQVLELDLTGNRVAVSGALGSVVPGDVVVFTHGGRKSSFTVAAGRVCGDRTWLKLKEQIIALRGETRYVESGSGRLHTDMLVATYGTGPVHSGRFAPDLTNLFLASADGQWSTPIRSVHLCPLDKGTDADFIPPGARYIQVSPEAQVPAAMSRPGGVFYVLEVAPGSTMRCPAHVVRDVGTVRE